MKAVIHSQKHYVQQTRSTVATVSIANLDIAIGVQSTTASGVDDVTEGTLVKAVYVEMWLLDSSNAGSFIVTLEKRPSASALMTFASSNALGTYANKNNVLYCTQGLSPNDAVGNPVPIIRQWFKIPKGKQRMALGDILALNITNNGANNLDFCGFFTYKEIS